MKSIHSSWLILLVFVCDVSTRVVSAQGILSDPIALRMGESILDVEHEGYAAPAVMDVDGDGLQDLLVGGGFKGILRIYRNQTSNLSPQFANYGFFQNGKAEGRVPDNWGFCPDTIDLDRDGLVDIITPAWHGQIYLFRQTSPGIFAKSSPLRNTEGEIIKTEWTFGATACDWDNDGFPDVIFSQRDQKQKSNIYLLRNAAKDRELCFENPVSIMVDKSALYVKTIAPAPKVADWNGDGLFDLLIGTSEGSVLLYQNIGQPGKPKFAQSSKLISEPEAGSERGGSARPCIVDWNGDGRLDILLGDSGKKFERVLSKSEVAAKAEAKLLQENAFTRWSQAYRIYRQLKQTAAGASKDQGIAAVRDQMISLTHEQDYQRLQFDSYFEGQQTHGRVWLFLGQ